jgi:hypothetical protein
MFSPLENARRYGMNAEKWWTVLIFHNIQKLFLKQEKAG